MMLWMFLLPLLQVLPQQGYKPPTYIPSVPTAMELFKYINYPVNHSTGLVDISIPLYEIKVGDIVLPISLKYHSSGIKVLEAPSWVGAGWTLEAEPIIGRIIMGTPDEIVYLGRVLPDPNKMDRYEQEYWYANGASDLAPDKFSYRLIGKSGEFYFAKKQTGSPLDTAIIHPYEPIRVAYTKNNSHLNLAITDEKANVYTFNESEYTQMAGNLNQSAWKCTSIASQRRGETLIGFEYSKVGYHSVRTNNDAIQIEYRNDPHSGGSAPSGDTSFFSVLTNGKVTVNEGGKGYYLMPGSLNSDGSRGPVERRPMQDCPTLVNAEYMVSETKLSKINFGTGNYVKFTHQLISSLPQLKTIEVYIQNQCAKTFTFSYSPLGISSDLCILSGIEIQGMDSSEPMRYTFEYHHPGRFPGILSQNFDLWGYSNALIQRNETAVPFQTFRFTTTQNQMDGEEISFGGSRYADSEYMKSGILTSIIYPTKGKKVFTYEPNRFMNQETNRIEEGGGLRIKEMADYSHWQDATPQIVRTYKYGQNEDGLGYCNNYPSLKKFVTKSTMVYYINMQTHWSTTVWRFSNSPYPNSSCYPGESAVVYDTVSEYIDNSLKTTYKYHNSPFSWNFPYNYECPYYYDYRNSWKYGSLTSETQYKKVGNEYKSIKSKQFVYENFLERRDYSYHITRTLMSTGSVPTSGNQIMDFCIQRSQIELGARRVTQEVDTHYDGIGQISTKKTYTYHPDKGHLFPASIATTQSDGTTIENTFKYPTDVTLSGNAETARKKLIAMGAVNTLLEESAKCNGAHTHSTAYHYKVFTNSDGKPLLWKIDDGISPQTREERTEFTQYTTHGSPLALVNDAAARCIYIWANHGNDLIAEVKNMSIQELSNTIDINTLNNLDAGFCHKNNNIYAKIDALRNQKDVMVTTYKYDPCWGILEITNPTGFTTHYEYDGFGRLKRTYFKDLDKNERTINQYQYNFRNQ